MRRIITTLGALPLAVHWQHVCAAKQKCEKRSASGQWRVREDAEGWRLFDGMEFLKTK